MRRDRYCVPRIQHVLLFWNNEVFENTEGVLHAIYDALTPTLSQREREFQAKDTCLRQAGTSSGKVTWIARLRQNIICHTCPKQATAGAFRFIRAMPYGEAGPSKALQNPGHCPAIELFWTAVMLTVRWRVLNNSDLMEV